MAITIASYVPLLDADFTISGTGDERTFPLNVPLEHISGTGGWDVLQFRVTTRNSDNLRFVAEVNPHRPDGVPTEFIQEFTYGPSDTNLTRGFHELLRSVVDSGNDLRFRISGGSGAVTISDIILWYRVSLQL